MQASRLGAAPAWQSLQLVWGALLALPVAPRPSDWDLLRLVVEQYLQDLEALVGVQLLSWDEIVWLRALVLARLEEGLQAALPQQALLTPYYQVLVPDRHERYSRYQALQEMEQTLSRLLPELPVLAQPKVMQALLDDANLAALAYAAKHLLAPETEAWPQLLALVAGLGAQERDARACWQHLAHLLSQVNAPDLAERILTTAQEPGALLSALRTLGPVPNACQAFQSAVLGPSPRPYAFILRALQAGLPIGPEPDRQNLLWQLVLAPVSDNHRQPGLDPPFAALRQAALVQLRQYPEMSGEELQTLDTARQRLDWGRESQLRALQALNQWHLYVGYETASEALRWAVHRDYQELAELALDILTTLQDPRTLPLLRSLRRHLLRNVSALERLGGGFAGAHLPLDECLVQAMKALGVEWVRHPVTGRWEERA